ncbi:MAG: metalloregulator ArsR/SmtB family transcription factor [Candidatus Micrarchaeaceae archaeon]
MDKLEVKTFLFVISDYSRFRILTALMEGKLNVSGIVAATGMEQSNVSHHMECLLNCGFVIVKRSGKERIYGLNKDIRPIINSIVRHIRRYKTRILTCNVANKEYISKVIK